MDAKLARMMMKVPVRSALRTGFSIKTPANVFHVIMTTATNVTMKAIALSAKTAFLSIRTMALAMLTVPLVMQTAWNATRNSLLSAHNVRRSHLSEQRQEPAAAVESTTVSSARSLTRRVTPARNAKMDSLLTNSTNVRRTAFRLMITV